MTDYKALLRDIVEIFYQSPFKIFNINSLDGETMIKPFGYFISLGITTSLESLKSIRDYISKSDYGFDARLVEIQSIKSDQYGDYLNTILPTSEDDITKYVSPIPPDLKICGESEITEMIRDLKSRVQEGDFRCSPYLSRLNEVLEKIDGSWDTYSVQFKDGVPGVFHQYINYKKTEDSEYRIGIYVTKN